jgi:hypothetical protein
MPNPMPFICTAALTAALLIPSLATAAEPEDTLKPAMQRTSLGLRLGTDTVTAGFGGAGLGGLLGIFYTPGDGITVGIPLGDSAWRLEPSFSGSYTNNENSSQSSINLGLMPQRVIVEHTYGSFYAGASFQFMRTMYSIENTGAAESSISSTSFGVHPLLGVQGMLGESLSVGFEVGPSLRYTPEPDTDSALGELASTQSLAISTSSNLTLKYYF